MKINLSEENSKRVLSGTKWLTNAGRNYFTSLNGNDAKPTGSVKKVVNAILLVPIIVPTALTVLSFGFTMLLLNAVSAQKDDSTLPRIAKGTARLLIYIVAAALLITCVILNLVISLVPSLIFLVINKDIFNQKSVHIETNQGQNEVEINSNEEYAERIAEEVSKFKSDQQQQDDGAEQYKRAYSQALVNSDQLYNQPDVEVISRVSEGEQAVDQTVIAKRINSDSIQDGKAMIRTVVTESSVTMKGIMTGNDPDQPGGSATCFSFKCNVVEDGVDFSFGASMRTGNNQQEATQRLLQSESAGTMLSGDGRLSIEQPGSSQQK